MISKLKPFLYLTQLVANAIQTNHSLNGSFEKTERACNEYFLCLRHQQKLLLQRKHDRGRRIENNKVLIYRH